MFSSNSFEFLRIGCRVRFLSVRNIGYTFASWIDYVTVRTLGGGTTFWAEVSLKSDCPESVVEYIEQQKIWPFNWNSVDMVNLDLIPDRLNLI